MLSFVENWKKSKRRKVIQLHLKKLIDSGILCRRTVKIYRLEELLEYIKTSVGEDIQKDLLKELKNQLVLWQMEDEVDRQIVEEMRREFSEFISESKLPPLPNRPGLKFAKENEMPN